MHRPGHLYRAIRVLAGGRSAMAAPVCLVSVNGLPLPRSRWAQQTSTDDDWGYEGTGPRALAHALLTDELGSQIAEPAARAFEQEVIAELPRDRGGEEWTLTGQQVRDWWHTRRLLADVLAPLEAADRLQEPPDDDDDPIPDEKDMMDEHEEPGVIPAWELQELLQRTQAQGRRGALDLLRALVEAGVMDEKQRAAAEQALRHRWQEIDEARAP